MSYVCHPVICWFAEFWILKYKYYVIFIIIIYFQFLKTCLTLRKREFYWSTLFCLTNKKFPFSVKRKRKQIFILQNSKIRQISKSPDEIQTTLGPIQWPSLVHLIWQNINNMLFAINKFRHFLYCYDYICTSKSNVQKNVLNICQDKKVRFLLLKICARKNQSAHFSAC